MKFTVKSWLSRVGIMVIAAIMVEAITVVQYQRIHAMMAEDMAIRSSIALEASADKIGHVFELTETTMNENMRDLRRAISNPDSVFRAIQYTIDDNPNIVSGCIGFVPEYYRSKGYYFEPVVFKTGDKYDYKQLGSPSHDYTSNPAYIRAIESGKKFWSDPYYDDNGGKPMRLITFTCPLSDEKGVLAGVIGLDMDVSWLGDTLNNRQKNESSFLMLLTSDRKLVATPSVSDASQTDIAEALRMINQGKELSDDNRLSVRSITMNCEPFWHVVQVCYNEEVFAPMRRMRRQQVVLIVLGLAILFFMIERFYRSQKKLREATVEQARINGELSVARRIQEEMLPKKFPSNIYGSIEPAREIGGDIFDFYERDGKLFFCIGDVAGKGVPAAMLMSVLHSLFRTFSSNIESPSFIARELNAQICRGNDSNMFVTLFIGCLDLYSGKLEYCNAGHDKPFLLSSSANLMPVKANLPLGAFPDVVFVEESCVLAPGTSIFLYTDGLTESKNANRELFSRARVKAVLNSCLAKPDETPEMIVNSMFAAAKDFMGNTHQADDLTMLLIKYQPGELVHDQITLSNNLDEVEKLGIFVKDFCNSLGIERKMFSGIRLALEESVVNVINYAYPNMETGYVTIFADSNRREVRFTIVDSGVPFDPKAVLSADTTLDAQNRPIGGLGVHLTRKLMDSISYTRKDGKNVLSLTKSIV